MSDLVNGAFWLHKVVTQLRGMHDAGGGRPRRQSPAAAAGAAAQHDADRAVAEPLRPRRPGGGHPGVGGRGSLREREREDCKIFF